MMLLRDYQTEAINALYAWFQDHEDGNPLIVLPTGAGKSLVQAKICEDALQWEGTRLLLLTHSKELIEQNFKTILKLWPEAPAGIYCAGLGKKQSHNAITFGSIQSVYKKAEAINFRDLVIIDEAHMLSDEESSMYRSFLSQLRAINPNLKVIGLSATPYRMKSGYLHEGDKALFSAICYELKLLRLIKEGYLAPLVGRAAVTHGDTNKLALQSGEFAIREAVSEFDRQEMTKAAVKEMMECGVDRKSWLIFCVSIEHAEHVRDALIEEGIEAAMVCDKTPAGERAQILTDLKAGRIRAVTNVSVLTTGFDAPGIDMLVLLRPTMSPGLLVQMCGRGMRPIYAPGADLTTKEGRIAGMTKPNCLVLDMAENLLRHGPITHIDPPSGTRREKKQREGKMCSKCRAINPFAALECTECGKPFEGQPRTIKHTMKAARDDVISDAPTLSEVPTWLTVHHVNYEIHQKPGKPDSLKVLYNCKPNYVMEWICFGHEHNSFPQRKAVSWWINRNGQTPAPASALEALQRIGEIGGMRTARVKAKKNGKFTEVISHDVVPSQTAMLQTGGNLGSRITQVEEKDAHTPSEKIDAPAPAASMGGG